MNEKLYTPAPPKRRKVALVSNSAWYTWQFRLGLIRRLQEAGDEVFVISPHDHYSSKLIAEGIHFVQLPIAVYGMNPLRELVGIWQLFQIYRRYQFDCIFHYTAKPNIYGSIAAWLRGIPSIAVTTGLGLLRDEDKGLAQIFLLGLYRLAGLLSRQMWFLNPDDRQFFLQKGVISPQKALVLPSEGVNIQWFRPREGSIPDRPPRFLYAGRLVWSKGLKAYYEAAKYFHQKGSRCSFHLVGFIVPEHPDAVSFDLVQKWQSDGVMRYHGETDDIRPFLSEADCVVLPSFFGEGVPRILLEAAAMGKPIITTDFVGCREVVQNGYNGLLCKPRNTQSLVDAIETFMALSSGARQMMGLKGRKKIVEQFDEAIVIKYYLKALEQFAPKELEIPARQWTGKS